MKAENSRVAELREILIGSDRSKKKEPSILYDEENLIPRSVQYFKMIARHNALDKIIGHQESLSVSWPPGTRKRQRWYKPFRFTKQNRGARYWSAHPVMLPLIYWLKSCLNRV